MNCTDAYHEALTRHFSSTAAPAPMPAPAPTTEAAAPVTDDTVQGDGSGTVGDGAATKRRLACAPG